MLDRPRPCAAEQKVRRWKVHQKPLQVWAAAANDPAVSICRRHRKRMAPCMTPQRTGCSPHSFQITIHHLLSLCCVASVCFFPADLVEGGQTPRLKRWSQRFPRDCKFDQQCKRVYSPTRKMRGMMMEKKIWWLTSCKLTSTRGWWMERGQPLVYKRCSLFMGDSIHFCVSFFLNPFQTNPTVGSVLNTGIDTLRTKEAVNSWPAASQLEAPWKVLFHLQNGTFLFLLILNIHVKSWEKTAEAINNLTTSIKNGT